MNSRFFLAAIKGIVRPRKLPCSLGKCRSLASLVVAMLAANGGTATAQQVPLAEVNFPACQAPVAGAGAWPYREGWTIWSRSQNQGTGPSCDGPPHRTDRGWRHILLVDINADGLDDLCGLWGPVNHLVTINGNLRPAAYDAYVYGCVRNQGNGRFGGEFLQVRAFNGLFNGVYMTIRAVDFNGDGRLDLCGRAVAGIVCQMATSTGISPNVSLVQASFSNSNGWHEPWYSSSIDFARMDGILHVCGRGIAGILCFPKVGAVFSSEAYLQTAFSDANGWDRSSYYANIRFVDVNGDGHTDVCGKGYAGIWCSLWRPSPTRSFGPARLWTTQFSTTGGGSVVRFGDINRIGNMADVCGLKYDGLYCGVSNGTSFLWATSQSQQTEIALGKGFHPFIHIVDFDGDGKNDVCSVQDYVSAHEVGIRCAKSTSTATSISFESLVTRTTALVTPMNVRPGRLYPTSPPSASSPTGFCWDAPYYGGVACSNQWSPYPIF